MKSVTTGTIVISALAAIGTFVLVCCRSVSVEAAYPVERARQSFARSVLTRIKGMFRGAEAEAENRRLRREVASLALLRGDVSRLEAENVRLRNALAYRARTMETWLAAGVLSDGGGAAGAHDTIRVDKGILDGVREGAVVVVPEGLVGRVASVTPHTAEVLLVSDKRMKVACEATAQSGRRFQGILCGGGGDRLRLRHLTEAADVPPRAKIFSSGLGGVFPKGIEVGTLLNVRKESGGLSYEGEVLPAVDFSTLEDVFIRREK